ncbi:zonular occludens toxin domain-containing protein [Paracidovorax valerianellae]|nr:zonular occludens toxin domain-containing protein [Paracidovorax valerianellae]MDA8446346.1 zonular occludens toxin [Paracidovorax valerianellae]
MLEEVGKGRQLYVNGIPDLKIDHQELAEPERWPELVPDGSVIIIDEVQRVWRPRGPGQKVPDHVAMLETHRHRGLDFYIITQGPNLVDSNVRALVGRHVHLRDLGILGRWWYEWPECADNCRTAWKNAPIKKRYRLPKHIFGKYKSASIHVKPIRSVPWMLSVMVAALVLVAVLSWYAYKAISTRMSPPQVPAPATLPQPLPGATVQAPPTQSQQAPSAPPDERVDFIPRLSDRPWTAPAYDHLRRVVVMPVITGAMCIDGQCVCFSGQRKLLDVTNDACNQWRIDRPFNPYVADAEKPSGHTPSAQAQTEPVPAGSASAG